MDTLIKPSILALTIASALSANANAEIIISQYVEGGSYNKAVEIANTGDAAVTLTGYELAKSSNGGGTWGSKIDLSQVTLQAKQVFVLAHGMTQTIITLTLKSQIKTSTKKSTSEAMRSWLLSCTARKWSRQKKRRK